MNTGSLNAPNLLDKIRLNYGIVKLKYIFQDLIKYNTSNAISFLNDEYLSFCTLFTLQHDIAYSGILMRLHTRQRIALQIVKCIASGDIKQIRYLLAHDRQIVYRALKWIIETGCADDGFSNEYDKVLDTSAVLLIKIYKDKTTLHFVADMIFDRHKKGRLVHNLVWVFTGSSYPDFSAIISDRLRSPQWSDVKLAQKIVSMVKQAGEEDKHRVISIDTPGQAVDFNAFAGQYPQGSIERKIIDILRSSTNTHIYNSINQLEFELRLRKNIINAAIELYRSNMSFRTFRDSFCNQQYWQRSQEGGFLLKPGIRPSDAIRDIFMNSSLYGTECATAIVIVFYRALVNTLPERLFNELFANIYLMDWRFLDPDLGIMTYSNPGVYLPGDCRYFKNPEVDPLTPQWQGENAIDLGNGTYYGHGIGIRTANEMIEALNRHRVEGAQESAYLMDSVTLLNFKYLSSKYHYELNPSNHF